MGRKLDCVSVYDEMMRTSTAAAAELASTGHTPCLATVLVGADPASAMYVAMKQQLAAASGIQSRDVRLDAGITQGELEKVIADLDADDAVDAVLIQYPLPAGLDYTSALLRLRPHKDVDGLHPVNLGLLMAGESSAVLPCTPAGIVELLKRNGHDLVGEVVTIVGRGLTVGRPLAALLTAKEFGNNASVRVVHSRSGDSVIAESLRGARVVIGAAGVPGLIRPEWLDAEATIVAAGVSFPQGKAVSDFGRGARDVVAAWTPTTGGVGALTRAFLFSNVIRCARLGVAARAGAVADGSTGA